MSKHLETFLKRNRELAEAATKAPWENTEIFELRGEGAAVDVQCSGRRSAANSNGRMIIARFAGPDMEPNAALVAASRTSLPLALEMLEACREQLEFIAGGCLVPPDGGSPRLEDAVKAAAEALAALEEKAKEPA